MRHKQKPIPIGSVVRSHYRNRWFGVVVAAYDRAATDQLLLISIICDRRGYKLRKRRLKFFSTGWVDVSEKVLPIVNADWLVAPKNYTNANNY